MPGDSARVDVPQAAVTVVRRYHRLERLASGAFALLAAGVVAAAVLLLPLLHALAAAVVVLAVVRVPVFRSHGTARLATDADPADVREDFAGPTPPVLATQWGVADVVRRTDDGAVYEVSYLFGLRSVSLEVEAREESAADGVDGLAGTDADLEVVVTANGRPWATFAASIGGSPSGGSRSGCSPSGTATTRSRPRATRSRSGTSASRSGKAVTVRVREQAVRRRRAPTAVSTDLIARLDSLRSVTFYGVTENQWPKRTPTPKRPSGRPSSPCSATSTTGRRRS